MTLTQAESVLVCAEQMSESCGGTATRAAGAVAVGAELVAEAGAMVEGLSLAEYGTPLDVAVDAARELDMDLETVCEVLSAVRRHREAATA